MTVERARIVEIVASIVAVALMIALLSLIGRQYTNNGTFGESGGMMLIVAIIVFVLLMSVIGYVLAFTITTREAEAEAATTD